MKTIYKYELETIDRQGIMMPKGAKILHLGTQKIRPFIWCMVDNTAHEVCREIIIYGTGHEIGDLNLDYIGTYQLYSGDLVFHVFDGGES